MTLDIRKSKYVLKRREVQSSYFIIMKYIGTSERMFIALGARLKNKLYMYIYIKYST